MQPLKILLVEDNPGDVRLLTEALAEGQMPSALTVVHDGVAALAYLRRAGAGPQRPDLIVLDLNLPLKSGREVLAELKDDPTLKRIPVVIFTSSEDASDVRATYNLHANCYVAKPGDLEQFITVGRSIQRFWMTTAQLPPAS